MKTLYSRISFCVLSLLCISALSLSAQESTPRIGILHRDTHSPVAQKAVAVFEKLGYDVAVYDFDRITRTDILTPENIDILVIACGPDYPADGKDALVRYLSSGGAFFSLYGYAFDNPLRNGEPDPLTRINTRYGRPGDWLSVSGEQIGVFDPSYMLENTTAIKPAPQSMVPVPDLKWEGNFEGWVATSMVGNNHPIYETLYGRWYPILHGYDSYDRSRGSVLSLVHVYDDVYKGSSWAFCGLLDPDDLLARAEGPAIIRGVVDALMKRTYLHDFSTNFALYEKGESPELTVKVSNFGKQARTVGVQFHVKGGADDFSLPALTVDVQPGETKDVSATWHSPAFTSDFYTVTASMAGDGVQDRIETAFVVRDESILSQGLDPQLVDNYFRIRNKPEFFVGVNQTGLMWYNEDPLIWDTDFRTMRDRGMHIMRVLHFIRTQAGPRVDYQFSEENFDVRNIPQKLIRQTDAIVQLLQKHKVIYFLDINAGGRPAQSDAELAAHARWNEFWVTRYKNVPGLIIDIQNEPRTFIQPRPEDVQREWKSFLVKKYGSLDDVAWNPGGGDAAYDFGQESFEDDNLILKIGRATPDNIDGVLDDPAWRRTSAIGPFVNSATGGISGAATECRIAIDGEKLYIGFACTLPGVRVQGESRGNDEYDVINTDDCMDFRFSTGEGRERQSYRIVFGAGGGVLDDLNGDPGWYAKAEYRVRPAANGWTGEAAIPLEAFGESDDWRMTVSQLFRSYPGLTGGWQNNGADDPRGRIGLNTSGIVVGAVTVPQPFNGRGEVVIDISGSGGGTVSAVKEVRRADRSVDRTIIPLTGGKFSVPFDLDPALPDMGRILVKAGEEIIYATPWFRGYEWLSLKQVDYELFRIHILNRWVKANSDGIRKGDPDRLHTVGFLPTMQPADKILGTEHTDFSNMHFYGATMDFAKRYKIIDRRFLNKSITLGEFGSREPHDARVWGRTGTFYREAIDRYMATVLNGYGLGGAFAIQWDWKDFRGCIFPWGLNFSHELVPKDILLAYRNIYYFLKLCGPPKYEDPGVYFLAADNNRLGGNWDLMNQALLFQTDNLIACGVPFNVINEFHLARLPEAAKVLIAPMPYVLSDESFSILERFVRDGGKLYISGDVSWDTNRQRTKTERFAALSLPDPGLHYPIVPQFGKKDAVVRNVGAGQVYFVPKPVEMQHDDETLLHYRRFLNGAGIPTAENPTVYRYRVPTTGGGTVHVFHNREDKAQTVPVGEYLLTLRPLQTGVVCINADGKIQGVKCGRLTDMNGNILVEMPFDGMVISTDGKGIAESAQLLLMTREAGGVHLPILGKWKNPVMEIGTVENAAFRSFEKKAHSTSFAVAEHQKLCLILLADGDTNVKAVEDALILK